MTRYEIYDEYFEWLYHIVCENRYSDEISFRKLLTHLHDVRFKYFIPKDQNRAEDGVALRLRFVHDRGYDNMENRILDILDFPCSVLEMMIALAIRCEVDIMDDPQVGDRTTQWFWEMVVSLGLGSQQDTRYDAQYVDTVLDIFLHREYEPNGKGGLFTIKHCDRDLRDVEIWHQLCWYLDSIA